MNYKNFPELYWSTIESTIADLKKSNQKLIAAFDADGTLWDTDLGENFFQYQIDNRCVELPQNPWEYYFELKKVNNDPKPAYAWLAQINLNQNLNQVRAWAQNAFDQILPKPIFSEQKKLIDLLHKNDVEVFIVTASVKWAVEPGANVLGINSDHVIGIETEITNNLISAKIIDPITYRQGKADALLKHTNGLRPFLASGNTIGDFELLQSATHLKLAVSASAPDDRIYKTEVQLTELAKQNNWWSHRFI